MFFLLAATLATLTPLNDLGPAPYAYGYYGGLWDNGTNAIPADHAEAGLRQAALIEPLDRDGKPSPNGTIAFVAAGGNEAAAIANAFTGIMRSDPRVASNVVFLNAAAPVADATHWFDHRDPNFDRVRDRVLTPATLTEKQVQVAWIEMQDDFPFTPLPIQYGDAYWLKSYTSAALRAMKYRWPNLRIAYLSSRTYGGYAVTARNPEPYAYESGLAMRWIVVGQTDEVRNGGYLWDSRIGDIDYEKGSAPWVTWGPYFWANGMTPRSDGLTWSREDYAEDGETLSEHGAAKAAGMLMSFLLAEPTAQWFRGAGVPARVRAVRAP